MEFLEGMGSMHIGRSGRFGRFGAALAIFALASCFAYPAWAADSGRKPLLVVEPDLLARLGPGITEHFDTVPAGGVTATRLLDQTASGGGLVWIGSLEGRQLPPSLWVGTFRPSEKPASLVAAPNSPLPLDSIHLGRSTAASIYIKPAEALPIHNVNEEPRANLIPVLLAKDRFGGVIGYAGALMRYYAPSLTGGRFQGSDCYFFPVDHPADALSVEEWTKLLEGLARHFESRTQLEEVKTEFASYRSGDRIQVTVKVGNAREQAASVELHILLKAPNAGKFQLMAVERRVPAAHDSSVVHFSFPAGEQAGLWTVRVEAWQDLTHAEKPGMPGHPVQVDRQDAGFVVLGSALRTPHILRTADRAIEIDGTKGFLTGTNYYPSSSFWEWLWRDFHPIDSAEDFASMRRTGYRIVRVWVDPSLDEQALRGLEAAVYLASREGIVLDVCIFTQWVREIGFQRPDGRMEQFEFRNLHDFNVYGISLRHIDLQREYAATLARRLKGAGNVFYDLANETYIRDPDKSQIDPEFLKRHPNLPGSGTRRDSMLFRAWAEEIEQAMRQAGATQLMMPGYMFTGQDGGDTYLANRAAPIQPWHAYSSFDATVATMSYEDPSCSVRPILLEEFGLAKWNPAEHYDAMVHAALATGATGAMSYEWGIHWLEPELSFVSLPLRDFLVAPKDPRFLEAVRGVVQDWPEHSTGINASLVSFQYGTIYSGTPFPVPAAVDLGRLSRMGQGMERSASTARVAVLIPSAPPFTSRAMASVGKITGRLAALHVPFGILQQDCLASLPANVQLLILPEGTTGSLRQAADKVRHSSVALIDAAEPGWDEDSRLPRIPVTPGDVNLLVRDVVGGRLYSLEREEPSASPVTISLSEGRTITLGLSRYAEVRQRATAVDWIEGAGEIRENGNLVVAAEDGRIIIATEEGQDLASARMIRLLAAHPTTIHFSRAIRSASAIVEGKRIPVSASGDSLVVDDQLVRYEMEVRFQ